jgi:hypothetical protein
MLNLISRRYFNASLRHAMPRKKRVIGGIDGSSIASSSDAAVSSANFPAPVSPVSSQLIFNPVTSQYENPNPDWLSNDANNQQETAALPRWMTGRSSISAQTTIMSSQSNDPKLQTLLDRVLTQSDPDFTPSNIEVLDVRERCGWCDFMIVVEALDSVHMTQLTSLAYGKVSFN